MEIESIFKKQTTQISDNEWLADLFIKKEIIILYGESGIGKTQFTMQFLIQNNISAVYYNIETDDSIIESHLKRYGYNIDELQNNKKFAYRHFEDDTPKKKKLFFQYLENDVNEVKPDVIVIDMIHHTYPYNFNENNADHVNTYFYDYKAFAIKHNISIIFLMHRNKLSGNSENFTGNDLRGSSAFYAFAGYVFKLVANLNNNKIDALTLLIKKSRLSKNNITSINYLVNDDFIIEKNINKEIVLDNVLPIELEKAVQYIISADKVKRDSFERQGSDFNNYFSFRGTFGNIIAAMKISITPKKLSVLFHDFEKILSDEYGITYKNYGTSGMKTFFYNPDCEIRLNTISLNNDFFKPITDEEIPF